jgi:hypothetical protein
MGQTDHLLVFSGCKLGAFKQELTMYKVLFILALAAVITSCETKCLHNLGLHCLMFPEEYGDR